MHCGHVAAQEEWGGGVSTNANLLRRVARLMLNVRFPGYAFNVFHGHGGVYLQGTYDEPCAVTGEVEAQYTRKWLVSPQMTDSEIVFTAFKLCLTSMEHRTREFFTYKGERIASPHFDVEDLVRLCREGRADAGGRP